jgi:radical SAM superfamily enzyme with C-terminal helix-hairpin-helix motif
MKDEDIVGKEFSIFKYADYKNISWESKLDEYIGSKGRVKNIHPHYPEYTNVEIKRRDYTVMQKHFPTHLIKEQIEKEENRSVDDILNEMKHLISRI